MNGNDDKEYHKEINIYKSNTFNDKIAFRRNLSLPKDASENFNPSKNKYIQ